MSTHSRGKGNIQITVSFDVKFILELMSVVLNQPMKKLAGEAVYLLYEKYNDVDTVISHRTIRKMFQTALEQADMTEYSNRIHKKKPKD